LSSCASSGIDTSIRTISGGAGGDENGGGECPTVAEGKSIQEYRDASKAGSDGGAKTGGGECKFSTPSSSMVAAAVHDEAFFDQCVKKPSIELALAIEHSVRVAVCVRQVNGVTLT
jgi:hypothetical protein